jgi:Ser/Thr protein kinase RdoA (MazF antagonist)
MPAPVPAPDGGCLAWVAPTDGGPEIPVRVHAWAESSVVPRAAVGADLARWVGGALARVHGLALAPLQPELYAGRIGLTTAEVWPDLVARSANAPWVDALVAAEPLARRASALLRPWDPGDAVLVHGDVDQKNLLLGPDGPLLIDWDVVLPAVPSHDLAHAALTMAGWSEPAVAAAVVRGYRDAGGAVATLSPYDLGPALASRLGWIRFGVDRALDGSGPVPDVPALLADLRHRVEVAESLPAWLDSTR